MSGSVAFSGRHYTLERDNRELQLANARKDLKGHYTLERDDRELQPWPLMKRIKRHYTLERDNRELQPHVSTTQ